MDVPLGLATTQGLAQQTWLGYQTTGDSVPANFVSPPHQHTATAVSRAVTRLSYPVAAPVSGDALRLFTQFNPVPEADSILSGDSVFANHRALFAHCPEMETDPWMRDIV
eukprot:201797-Rhodomonas_salina.1